jgi:1-acyl-sn-glycerol-3-phosphate acyltransferase
MDHALIAFGQTVATLGFRLRVEGEIPPDGPLIIAANHISLVDPVVLGFVIGRAGRIPRFIIGDFLLTHAITGPVFRRSSAIPASQSLRQAPAVLEAGRTVVVYPEGHVARRDRPLRAKLGVALLSKRTGAPVLPVALAGMERQERPLGWARRRPAAIVFGTPLPAATGNERVAANAILDAIRALLPRAQALAGSPTLGMKRGSVTP